MCLSLTADELRDTVTAEHREGGGAKHAVQDVRGAVVARTCLFLDETRNKLAT